MALERFSCRSPRRKPKKLKLSALELHWKKGEDTRRPQGITRSFSLVCINEELTPVTHFTGARYLAAQSFAVPSLQPEMERGALKTRFSIQVRSRVRKQPSGSRDLQASTLRERPTLSSTQGYRKGGGHVCHDDRGVAQPPQRYGLRPLLACHKIFSCKQEVN